MSFFATRNPKDFNLKSDSLIQFGGSPRANHIPHPWPPKAGPSYRVEVT